MESNDATCGNRDLLAGLRVAAGALWLVAQLEVAEARKLDRFTPFECRANLLEETLDHVRGLTLVEANTLKEQFSQFGLGQCRAHIPHPRSRAPKEVSASPTMAEMADSTSRSSS